MVHTRRQQAKEGDDRFDLVALPLGASDPGSGRATTDAEVAANLPTVISAGHETTATGTVPNVPAFAVPRHPALWDQPEAFDPERFSPERTAGWHRYLPFGTGPRTCIGAAFSLLEAQAILGVPLPAPRVRCGTGPMPGHRMRMVRRPLRDTPVRVARRGAGC